MLEVTKVDRVVREIIGNKQLLKSNGVDRKVVYDMRNDEKRKVSFGKKLEFLWSMGYLVLKDGKQQ